MILFFYMSDQSKKESSNNSDFQDAASLLLKGGCLISESCPDCSGVQIRFKDDTICVNCGKGRSMKKESSSTPELSISQEGENDYSKLGKDLSTVENMLVGRIVHLTTQMNSQTDLLDETRIAGLIEIYVRIVEKIRSL
jgi:uncharacterized Zn finger protein (UPF0148 family)